ncbi:MAG: outer membrane beta-barrel protein [Rhizobacter sp.]|nr:outer membrane beta-barrel protein [Rhizobacter sp.]
MNKGIALAALALATAAGTAQAAEVRPVLGMGLTFGGDTLVGVTYTNGDTAKVHAGGLVALNGGVEVRFTDLVSAQALVGYHVDRANASNGDVVFDRVPFELLGHFRLTDWMRVGGGARYTPNAKLRADGYVSGFVSDVDFKPTVGTVVEAEFFPWRTVGIKARYVSERFKAKDIVGAPTVDGSHGGIYINYYFF